MTDRIASDLTGKFHEWVFTTAFTSVSTPIKCIVLARSFLFCLAFYLLINLIRDRQQLLVYGDFLGFPTIGVKC